MASAPGASAHAIDHDPEFQVILEQLRAQGASDEEIERTMEQAKQFYLQQKDARASEMKQTSESEQYPPSFHAIVELIATGQESQIPGIRDIPLKINPAPPSESKMECPKKPWESC
ncbi:hypothetical protein DNF11_0275 [Malassezia restricta CBS 7877]|uniref:Peroxisomal membrane protein PEX14-like KPWE domain-containing protein n=1 Tax=Malassezia restricta (strain ATCC 96810 / NBRC 103918 / CBS 7877) TaxID=425264 RepID=A0A3G2RZW1_MALR7|nr:hypothetical protein DNF11_0275 [Malassezia restricta CBS 7877]